MAYWLNLFSIESWAEFKAAGGGVDGFRAARWSRAQKVRPGDRMLAYLVGASRWVGVLEAVDEPYFEEDESKKIWSADFFPARIPVRILHELTPETAVPVIDMLDVSAGRGSSARVTSKT